MLAHPLTADRALYRAQEREDAERRAEDMAAFAEGLERQAEVAPDDELADALHVLSSLAEDACARLIQEISP